MRIRANAKWASLTAKQIEVLEQWLFDDKLSYDEILERAKNEFGFTGSRSSLQRFFQRLQQDRWLKKLMESRRDANDMTKIPVNTAALTASGIKLLGLQFFEQVRAGVEKLTDVPTLARILLHSQANEIQREENYIRKEGLELRRRTLDFQEKCWQFDLIAEAENILPELQKLNQARQDANDPYAENKRLNAIRIRLFGSNTPELMPENAQQEAELAQAKAHEAAQREREYQQLRVGTAKPCEPIPTSEISPSEINAAETPESGHPPTKPKNENQFLTKLARPDD